MTDEEEMKKHTYAVVMATAILLLLLVWHMHH